MASESSITISILKYLKGLDGCKAEKRHGSAYSVRGAPDIRGCYNSQAFDIEVKKPGGVVSHAQKKELAGWQAAGSRVLVAYNLQGVKDFIQSF